MPLDNDVVMGEKEQSLYMYIYNIYKQCRKSVEVEAAARYRVQFWTLLYQMTPIIKSLRSNYSASQQEI